MKTVRSITAIAAMALAMVGMSLNVARASGIETIAPPKKGLSLLSLGTAPEKKKIVLNLGELRVREAALPPGPLTLAERQQMRVRAAVSIEDEVSRARRIRLANRNAPAPKPETADTESNDSEASEDEEVADEDTDAPEPEESVEQEEDTSEEVEVAASDVDEPNVAIEYDSGADVESVDVETRSRGRDGFPTTPGDGGLPPPVER